VIASVRKVPFLDLSWQHRRIESALQEDLARLFASQQFILGEPVARLERELAAYCRCAHAIGCASGSDALYLALLATGVQPGDEVLTTPYTFFATAGAIHRLGARPVFCDVDERMFHMDNAFALRMIEERPSIRAVVPVHLFGACADMGPLRAACDARGIPLVEDAAQAIGAEHAGRRAGGFGHVGSFSFFPTKNLGAYGDAGLLTTNDDTLADRLRMLRVHGSRVRYVHELVGINSRIDAFQAIVLLNKLPYLDEWNLLRQENASLYGRLLQESGAPVTPPAPVGEGGRHVFHQYVIVCAHRDGLRAHLASHGVGSEVYYPIPLHLQECFSYLGYQAGDLPVAERLAAGSLALPIYPGLRAEEIERVCALIAGFYRKA